MKLTILFDDETATQGTLIQEPSWIERLFGRRPRRAQVYFSSSGNGWYFADRTWVGEKLELAIKDEKRWRTVLELPEAIIRDAGDK